MKSILSYFLVTFLNENTTDVENNSDESYTIAFSEFTNKFVSNYSFRPNIYINNHKYLLSNCNGLGSISGLKKSLFLHNYGAYGTFFNNLENGGQLPYKCAIKVLVNDNPTYTKVFDNLVWLSESIRDYSEWSDDLNIIQVLLILLLFLRVLITN